MNTPTRTTRVGPILTVTLTLLVLVAAILLLRGPTYTRGMPGDPQNPDPEGAMAVAEVLAERGVAVRITRTVSATLAAPTDLLVVSEVGDLAPHQARALAQTGTDVVFLGATRAIPAFLADIDRHQVTSGAIDAGCADPRAGAGPITTTAPALSAPGATACFPGGEAGVMLTWENPDGTRGTILPDDLLTNAHLPEEANAALALRVLGEADRLTWLVASATDPFGRDGAGEDFSLTWLWAALGAGALALIWWRGPRFGRLVSEPLPVVVPASETTVGRGHLYRRAKDLPHAAAALRLGTLTALAGRLGLARHADRTEVAEALARASGLPTAQITTLVYGPDPTSVDELHALALALDDLEQKVDMR